MDYSKLAGIFSLVSERGERYFLSSATHLAKMSSIPLKRSSQESRFQAVLNSVTLRRVDLTTASTYFI